jgi:hypothetical protein
VLPSANRRANAPFRRILRTCVRKRLTEILNMKSLRVLFVVLVAILFSPACTWKGSAAQSSGFRATNVVIVVIDGPRQTEMWRDERRAHIPRLSGSLAPVGVLMPGFRNNGPTYTNAGHTALCTGIYEDIDNQGQQLPSHAGILQHFLRSSGLPASKAWLITSKDKLNILGDTVEPSWQGHYRPSVWSGKNGAGAGSGYAEDPETMAAAKRILAHDHPRLVFINLKEPDAAGHGGNWDAYLHALEASDAIAVELWNFLQADTFYRDKTAYFITHDHGRHLDGIADGFVSHGDGCEGCRGIALLAVGPDFKRGAVVAEGGEQIDVPVTVARILGFGLPDAKGRVLKELFQ